MALVRLAVDVKLVFSSYVSPYRRFNKSREYQKVDLEDFSK